MLNINKYDSLEYFKILDVTSNSSDEEIRQKYRDLAKYWHPDHNIAPNAVDMFQKISLAYEILKDKQSRLKYILLSIIYSKHNFPDMNSLCVLRNMHGQEDINMRAFHLIEITGKGFSHSAINKIYYTSLYEAPGVINNITRHNWLHGFLGVTAIFANIRALIQNYLAINNRKENLALLLHNSLAYKDEQKNSEAITLAMLAKEYATKEEIPFINQYISSFNDASLMSIKKWNFKKLKRIQLFYPLALFLGIVCLWGIVKLIDIEKNNQNNVNVKEVVVFQNGQKAFSDVAVARIFDIPVDVYDKQRLYHVIKTTNAMHGADKEFDIFKTVEKGTTVRLTGYTADNKWVRVMFDSGEMAFVEADTIEQGIGNEIPLWSKIYKEK